MKVRIKMLNEGLYAVKALDGPLRGKKVTIIIYPHRKKLLNEDRTFRREILYALTGTQHKMELIEQFCDNLQLQTQAKGL